ncbi:hypothetical protein [Tenacibaculum insulae]|uniref:hypothetical protein n=1 Tax=Tenacibaculum insulae TaxID=2029677 RepID=UPI003AB38755
MKKILLILLLFTYYINHSQSKKIIYVDEKYNEISFTSYQKKLSSKLFDIAIVEDKNMIYKKLRYYEYYSKLPIKTKYQLTKLFSKRFNIDSTKTLLIHYIDSVPDIKKMPIESGIEIKDSLNKTIRFISNTELKSNKNGSNYLKKHRHIQSFNDYIKNIKSEINKYHKKRLELIHFYNQNKGFPEWKLKEIKYFKDHNSLIKKIFSDKMKTYDVILIHSNGEFYVSNTRNHSYNKENKLAKKSFYDKQKNKWLKRLNKVL